jgi:hypothetical protein
MVIASISSTDATSPSTSAASNDSSSGRRWTESRRRVGVHGHGDDAATLPLREQRHHHGRRELTVLVRDGEQRVGRRRELHRRSGVDADRLALLRVGQGHHADDEHRSCRNDQQQGRDGAEHRSTCSALCDRRHRDAP